LAELKVSFRNYVATLRDYPVPREEFERFVCGILGLRRPDPFQLHTREADDWTVLISGNFDSGVAKFRGAASAAPRSNPELYRGMIVGKSDFDNARHERGR
jgi:hypothetical protein